MNIRNIILNTLVSIFIITLFLFAFTWIIFDFQGSSNSLKDTWSIVSSLFGGITTLAAAYIAAQLYSDWRNAEKFNVTKDTYIALIKLKSHIDRNYIRAKYHIDSYSLKDGHPTPNNDHISKRLIDAKNANKEREEYKSELNKLLADFFEKANIYEILFNDILVKYEDREYNFPSFMFTITHMYTQAIETKINDIKTTLLLSDNWKQDFEDKYLDVIVTKLEKSLNKY